MPTDVPAGPTSGTRRAAVVGSPVAHSLSPVLHGAAYRALGLTGWTYERLEADAEALPALADALDETWVGLSVTMPGKQAALAHAAEATSRAVAVGAANTLVRVGTGWRADCTDVDGVTGALRAAAGFTCSSNTSFGVVLGAGGTACAAVAGLADLGIRTVRVVAREPSRAEPVVRCAAKLGVDLEVTRWAEADHRVLAAEAAVLVNTAPAAAIEPYVPDLAAAAYVLDVIYHPWPTALAEAVMARGGRLATGLDMLLHQAFGQVEQFTGAAAPRPAMRDALREATGGILPLPISWP
ncbi:shikimate dehydrogenase [Actinophytocola gossypii]|uniref:Shikimate dehydrogenase n=1 Tax=Actinophytocola gossypii TaxID=2812003 RepID=A0ABT2J6V7_9PSEU|nr:shikimate dehydrogenase [Actinophytocola gossypii]MCT2583225.1 shikimate dehydrogenase [Actinophytocola gossypii]